MNQRQSIIVVVDPDADRATTLSSRLDHRGYHVIRRSSGTDALQCVAEYRPDLVLTEVELLDYDNSELLRSIRERSPSTRVLFMTHPGGNPRLPEERDPSLVAQQLVTGGVDEVIQAVDLLMEDRPASAPISRI
jgi:CheY-like chemotaxis protein